MLLYWYRDSLGIIISNIKNLIKLLHPLNKLHYFS